MEQFIKFSNLPQNPVSLCCIAAGNKKLEQILLQHGIECIVCEGDHNLPLPLRSHPDLNLHHLGGKEIVVNSMEKNLIHQLGNKGFSVREALGKFQEVYPKDVFLNAVSLNDCLICNPSTIDTAILKFSCRKQIISVKQGYTKCSLAIVDNNSFITSDIGMAKVLKRYNKDVLLIKSGEISLEGYEYGFIGGCCGLIAPKEMVFTGDISLHSDYKKIKAFLWDRQITYTCLSQQRLFDVGSIIPLKEYRFSEV